MSSAEMDVGREVSGDEERRRSQWVDPGDREPATIERELDATRADLQATLTALERRLSFDRLVDVTVGRIREHGGQFAGNLGHAATQNPVPLLLTSIGLGWMMLESRRGYAPRSSQPSAMRSSQPGATDRMAQKMDHISGKMHDAVEPSRDTLARARDSMAGAADSVRSSAGQAADSVRHAADSLRSSASEVAASTHEQVERARQSFNDMLEQQPLLLGALGLAAGAVLGALLPISETEDRVLGDARRRALQSAARTAREHLEQAPSREATAGDSDGDQYTEQTRGRSTDARDGERPARPH
jgi:hypothetical protein